MIDPEEVAAVIPESNKTLEVGAFIPCTDVYDVYFDKAYYLTPTDKVSEDAFAALRDGMRKTKEIFIKWSKKILEIPVREVAARYSVGV